MKTPLYCLAPFPPSLPHFPVTSQLFPNCSFCCPVSLAGWVTTPHLMCYLLNDNMDRHMSSLGTLVPEGPWGVFYASRSQVYWGLTHNVVFYWYSDLISPTHKHRQHSQGIVDWHTHVVIYLHHLLCFHSKLPLYIKLLNQ